MFDFIKTLFVAIVLGGVLIIWIGGVALILLFHSVYSIFSGKRH